MNSCRKLWLRVIKLELLKTEGQNIIPSARLMVTFLKQSKV